MKKQDLPTIANLNLDIDLKRLREETDTLAEKFVDVRTANPMLCDNHMELVADVYDNFEQINLTEPSEILPYEPSIKKHWLSVCDMVKIDGYWMEMGVREGRSVGWMLERLPKQELHGFDSWEGLTEEWHIGG